MPTNFIMTLIRNGYVRESKEVKEAWDEHFENEHFLTISDIRKICDSVIPRAKIRKHLYWRYSLIWTKREYYDR